MIKFFKYQNIPAWTFFPWCLLILMIPVWSAGVPACILLVISTTLINYRNLKWNSHLLIPLSFSILLYLLYLTGILWSENSSEAGIMLERKLSFLIFPLLFLVTPVFSSSGKRWLLFLFTAGAFIKSLFSIHDALDCYNEKHWVECFYSSFLSNEIHPAYQAVYDLFVISFFLYLLIEDYRKLTSGLTFLYLVVIVYFSVFIFFLASKAGIVSLILVYFLAFLYFSHKRKKLGYAILGFSFVLAASLAILYFSPTANIRFKDAFKVYSMDDQELFKKYKSTTESTAVRLMIWKVTRKEIKKRPFGTGTGDGMDVLRNSYLEHGMTGAYQENLNCHSQYLQTTLTLGYVGLVLLLLMLLVPLIYSLRCDNFLLLSFIAVILLNLSGESMFETQAGIVFYSVFNGFLLMNFGRNKQVSRKNA